MAEGSRAALGFIEEVTWGVTPSPAQLQLIDFQEESFVLNKTKERKKRVLPTREYAGMTSKTQETEGGFKTTLQAENTDALMQGVMMSVWADIIGGTGGGIITAGLTSGNLDIEFTIETGAGVGGIITFGSSVAAPSILLDQVIFADGTDNSGENDGSFIVTEVIDTHNFRVNDPLVSAVYESGCVISGDVIRNGSTIKSYTFEHAQLDIAKFLQYVGETVKTLDVAFEPEEEIMLEFDFLGKEETTSSTTISSPAALAAPNNPDFVCGDNVDGVYIDYIALAECLVQKLDLSVDNQTEGRKSIAVFGPCNARIKPIDVTGAITLYFDDLTHYNKYPLDTEFQLAILISDSDGNKFAITLAKTEFTTGSVNITDMEDEVPEEHEFAVSTNGVFTVQFCKAAA